jgi:hypothetical protein
MNKAKLQLDELAVESFATADLAAVRGTTIVQPDSPLCGPSVMESCETQCFV